MAAPDGKQRQRAWKPKARSGCKTCKIRKVKCDEDKPECQRCISTGRKCDGYDSNFRPQHSTPSPLHTTKSSPQSRSSTSLLRSQSPVYLVPALRLNTVEERESFEFFISHAVSSLRGFLDSPFWQREVLQAAHRDQAIQHCVVAMGAMHRRFFEGKRSHLTKADMSDKYLQFAFRQSNQAIRDLLKKQGPSGAIAKTDKVTLMTCSILFSSMCCLQGYQRDALEHLRSGIRMLNELDENDKGEDHPIDVESLRTIFVGLDMQARSIMPAYQSLKWVNRPNTGPLSVLPGSELSMTSLMAMLRYLESLSNQIHSFFMASSLRPKEEADDIRPRYVELVRLLHEAAVVLEAFWKKAAAFGDEFTQPLTALELLQCQMEYLVRSPRPDMEAKFNFTSAFTHKTDPFGKPFDIVDQFVRMFELTSKLLPISTSGTPVFTTTIGPISALWLVAFRAPSSCQALRKRAVDLMLSHPRREGFWDGMMAGKIAQDALRLEQERTCKHLGLSNEYAHDLVVPDNLRILAVYMSYPEDDDRRARVAFSDSTDLEIGVPGAVHWYSW